MLMKKQNNQTRENRNKRGEHKRRVGGQWLIFRRVGRRVKKVKEVNKYKLSYIKIVTEM